MSDVWVIRTLYALVTIGGSGWGRYQQQWYLAQGVTVAQLGVLRMIGFISKSWAYPLWGLVSDRHGIRFALLATIIASTLMLELHRHEWLFHSGFFVLCAAKMIRSASNSVWPLVDAFAISDPNASGSGYGRHRLYCSLAWGVASLFIGSFIDFSGSLSVIFYVTYLFVFLEFMMVLVFLPKPRAGAHMAKAKDGLWTSLQQFYGNSQMMTLFLVCFLHSFCISAADSTLFVVVTKLGGSTTLIGVSVLISITLEIPVFYHSGWLLDRLGTRAMVLLAQLCLLVRYLGYSFLSPDNLWLVAPLQILHGGSFACAWVALVHAGKALAPAHLSVTAQTVISAIWTSFGQGFGGAAWAYLYSHTDSSRTTFLGAAAVVCLVMIVTHYSVHPNFSRQREIITV